MATERLSPDAILASSGLTGTVDAIQDDPDSPDASWLTTGANTATEVHASFPLPSGNLTGTQEFRVLVRKTNQSTNPTCTVELYDNGSPVSTLVSSQTVSSTSGTVLSGTWSGSGSGATIECRVTGVTGGGNPGNRASVEVGAIEWNAQYSASTPVTVTPPSAFLTLSGLVPIVTTTAHQSVTPAAAGLILSGLVPSVITTDHRTVTPQVAELILTGLTPAVGAGADTVIEPSPASLALSGLNPLVAVSDHQTVIPESLGLSLDGLAPNVSVSADRVAVPSPASLSLTFLIPAGVATDHKTVTPAPATLELSGLIPTVGQGITATPNPAGLTLAGLVPAVSATDHQRITPQPAALAIAGLVPYVATDGPVVITPPPAVLSLAFLAPVVSRTAAVGRVLVVASSVELVLPVDGGVQPVVTVSSSTEPDDG